VQGVVSGCGERKDRRKRLDQASADVAREPVCAAQEHARAPIAGALIAGMARAELFRRQAGGGGLVSEVVVGAAPDERHVAGRELERGLRIVEPQPRPSLDNGMHRQLDGAGQPQPPRRLGHRPGKDAAGGASPGKVILQNVHDMSVLRNESSVKRIDSLGSRPQD
jgi:hypothetical protein